VAFYPSRSLSDQLENWWEHRGGPRIDFSFERSLDGIRRNIQNVDFVLVDATEDPAQASDAYFQIIKSLGPESMSVYTNIAHEGLELLVRRLGVALLLGPMSFPEWDDFFQHKFPCILPLSSAHAPIRQPSGADDSREATPVVKPFPIKSIAG
jgi:hypothetical protein